MKTLESCSVARLFETYCDEKDLVGRVCVVKPRHIGKAKRLVFTRECVASK
jgi:hypothetical protein